MKGWLGIAAMVIVYDGAAIVANRSTLSRQFHDAARAHPVVVTVATGYMVAHLYGAWPAKADPFNLFATGVRALT